MGNMHTNDAEGDSQALILNIPFAPPKGDVCLINNLPPELLSRIFEAGSEDNDSGDEDGMEGYLNTLYDDDLDDEDAGDDEGDTDTDGDGEEEETDDEECSDASGSSGFIWPPFQVAVSHICRHWREVALSTPSLWTTIEVTPQCCPPYQRVSTMLERSKGLPIDIFVDCEAPECDCASSDCRCHPSEQNWATDLKLLYELLVPHISRWRSIRIEVSQYAHMFAFLAAVSDLATPAASQLMSLELYHHEDGDTDEFSNFRYPRIGHRFVLFSGSAPRLTSVVLWGVHIDWDQTWIASSSTLKELQLAFHQEDVRPSWSQFTSILRGASSLESLSLRMSGPCGDPQEWFLELTPGRSSDPNDPIELPKVRELTLAFHSEPRAIGLLHKLSLPVLKELVLDFEDGDYTDFVDELIRLSTSLSTSKERPRSLLQNIEKLKIAGLPCRPECTGRLYGELQNLQSLNISTHYTPETFFDILSESHTPAGRSDVLLPRLVTLYVSGPSGDEIREVVKKRKELGAPLESLHVEESCDLTKRDVKWFKENVRTFEIFEGSDDEDDVDDTTIDYEGSDMPSEIDEWSD